MREGTSVSPSLQQSRGKVRALWDLLLVSVLSLPLLTPLWRWSSVPCTHDGHLHYYRTVAIGYAWESGLYFSRWLPDLAFGYGYPFLLYREALPLYLTHFLHQAGLPLPAATNLFYMLAILAAGWFTYLWVRDIFGAPAGIVAAVAYMAAPYTLIDALIRGNQMESIALALLPLLFWASRRFLLQGSARWFLLSVSALTALALSHNISLLIFTPTLGVYLLFVGWLNQQPLRPLLLRLLLLFGLGLGLTAFYTAPAVLEMDEVTLTLSTATRNNDFRFNFTSLQELLARVAPEDPALLNPPLPFRLGWVPAGLALFGLLSLAWNRERRQRWHVLFMAGLSLFYLFMSLPLSQPVWEALPLIEFVQFPWRFVGRAALPLAVLAGAPFASGIGISRLRWPALERLGSGQRWLWLLIPVAVSLLILEAIPLLYPATCREEPYPDIVDVHEYEHASGLVAVDPVGSYFPRTVQQRPEGSPLEATYRAGETPQRFDESQMPAGAAVRAASYAPNHAQIRVETPQPFQARYLTFAFPGWSVEIDGEPVTVTPSDPEGLITFLVPVGAHTITVDWQLTPLRGLFAAASLVALLGVAATSLLLRRSSSTSVIRQETTKADKSRYGRVLLLGVGLLLLALKLFLFDRFDTPFRHVASPPVEHATALRGGELQLAGYNLSQEQVPSGSAFDIHLAWETVAPPAAAYQAAVRLVGPEGATWSAKESFRPRIYEETSPTTAWPAGSWAWDSWEVQVLPGTPPGRYDLVLTLFKLEDLQPLTLQDEAGALRPTAIIGQIEVVRPETMVAVQPQRRIEEPVNDMLLLGYNQDRAEAAPGDPVLLTLFWEAVESADDQQQLELTLRNEAQAVVREWQIAPVPNYPRPLWLPGEQWRGQHLLRLPATLNSGAYRFWLENIPLDNLVVDAPERTFVEPAFEQEANVVFGDQAQLVAYTLAPPLAGLEAGETLTVTLVWQGLAEMTESYRVFVHLVDENGQVVAQSDGEPAAWQRPTSGWAPGEYIVDEHPLQLPAPLPAGPLSLRVGLYDAASGDRLPTPTGDAAIIDP